MKTIEVRIVRRNNLGHHFNATKKVKIRLVGFKKHYICSTGFEWDDLGKTFDKNINLVVAEYVI